MTEGEGPELPIIEEEAEDTDQLVSIEDVNKKPIDATTLLRPLDENLGVVHDSIEEPTTGNTEANYINAMDKFMNSEPGTADEGKAARRLVNANKKLRT